MVNFEWGMTKRDMCPKPYYSPNTVSSDIFQLHLISRHHDGLQRNSQDTLAILSVCHVSFRDDLLLVRSLGLQLRGLIAFWQQESAD